MQSTNLKSESIFLNRHRKFVIYLFVGGLNTVFGYGCFALLIFFGLHFFWASMFSTIVGIIFNFKTTGTVVFESTDNKLIFRFFGTYVLTFLISTSGIALFEMADIVSYYGGAIMILPMAFLSFYLNKNFVFNDEKTH